MDWLERLKNNKSHTPLPTKPTEPPFVGFVGTPLPCFKKTQSANSAQQINVAESLGRTLDYLTAADDRLPGLCLFSLDDIQDVEAGLLPLDNAKRYLENMERDYPHLQRGGSDTGEPPLLKALDELQQSGIELVHDDRTFIREKIGHRMDWRNRLDGYRSVWLDAMSKEAVPHRQQNVGRRAGNTWLRESSL